MFNCVYPEYLIQVILTCNRLKQTFTLQITIEVAIYSQSRGGLITAHYFVQSGSLIRAYIYGIKLRLKCLL